MANDTPALQTAAPKKERIVWIDQLRGIAFYFVILGHMNVPEMLKSWIYSFHMPVFFFITGFNYDIDKIAQTAPLAYLKKLGARLLVPYVWMQLLSFCLRFVDQTLLQHREVPVALWLRGILRGNSQIIKAPSNPLYFCLLLFCAELLLYIIIKLTHGRRFLVYALTLSTLPLSLLTETLWLRWHLNVAPACACMILCGAALGQMYRKKKALLQSLRLSQTLPLCAVLFLFGAAVWYFNGYTSVHGNVWGKDFTLAMLAALATSTALALLTMKLPKLGWLTLAGQNTLLFMGFHKPLVLIGEAMFPAWKTSALFLVLGSVAIYALLLPVTLLFRRFAPFVCGAESDFSALPVKIGQAVCLLGATCVPFWYFVNHLKGGFLRSSPLVLALAVAGYLLICAAAYRVMRRFVRFPFLPQKKEPDA